MAHVMVRHPFKSNGLECKPQREFSNQSWVCRSLATAALSVDPARWHPNTMHGLCIAIQISTTEQATAPVHLLC